MREEAGVKGECYPFPLQMSREEAINILTKARGVGWCRAEN